MNLIVAIAKNYAIGKNNNLLFALPSDLKFFKEKTINNIVVMGKSTYLSLPKRPLPNRINIVLSKDPFFNPPNTIVVRSLEELFVVLKKYDDNKIYICGGASIYNLLMDYCKIAYVTVVDEIVSADTYIKDIEKSGFKLECSSEPIVGNGHFFCFKTFINPNPKKFYVNNLEHS